jgi:hypothetical protein
VRFIENLRRLRSVALLQTLNQSYLKDWQLSPISFDFFHFNFASGKTLHLHGKQMEISIEHLPLKFNIKLNVFSFFYVFFLVGKRNRIP